MPTKTKYGKYPWGNEQLKPEESKQLEEHLEKLNENKSFGQKQNEKK